MAVMGWHTRLAGLAVAGALTVLASGCTGEAAPNTSTVAPVSSAPSTSAPPISASAKPSARPYPADVPLTGHNVKPGEKPPLYPAAARARTQEGANAFAEFYMRTLDWAYATTNPSYMKHYTGASCGLCSGLATGIQKTANAHHWYLGGRLTVHPATKTPVGPVTALAAFCSTVVLDVAAFSTVDVTGKVFTGDGAHTGDQIKLCFKQQSSIWVTTYMAGTDGSP
jgi:hypothetical protein